MYLGLAEIIVKKMQNGGFGAKQLGSGVLVWLNRNISTNEVQTVLEQNGLYFKVEKVAANQVMIEENRDY